MGCGTFTCSSSRGSDVAGVVRAAATTSDYAVVTTWGTTGTGNGQFETVSSLAVESAAVLVGDNSDRIQEFTHAGAFVASWGTTGSGDGQFENTDGLFATASPDGATVYIADSGALSRVQKFALLPLDKPCPQNTVPIAGSGQHVCLVTKWGQLGSADGDFRDPNSVALSSDGDVYVLDQNNNRVEVFRNVPIADPCPLGTTETAAYAAERTCFVRKWGDLGSGDGQLYGPENLALDEAGARVFVTDTFNHRIEVFRPDGTYLYKWGSEGTAAGQFEQPSGIAVDPARDHVVVADTGNSRIEVFDTAGQFITAFGQYGTGPGDLNYPDDVGLDAAGRIYVADQDNDRVQVFEQSAITGQTVTLAAGGNLTLAAGDYSAISVGTGARLTLSGGLYRTNNLVLADKATLDVTTQTELRVFQRVVTGEKTTLGPAPGSHLTADDLRIAVLGGDGTLQDPTAAAFTLGPKSDAQALAFVPYGSFVVDAKATFTGDVCAPGPTVQPLAGDACGLSVITRPGGAYQKLPGADLVSWIPIDVQVGACASQVCQQQAASQGTDLHCNSVMDTCCGLCGAGANCSTTTVADGMRGVSGNECALGYFCQSGACYDQRIDLPMLYEPAQSDASLLRTYDRIRLDPSRPAPEIYDPSQPIHEIFTSLGSFGAHAGTNTGHYGGDIKANDNGYIFRDRTGMFDLAKGLPPTAHCTYPGAPGEICAVPWQYLLQSTAGYHLPNVGGADQVFVVSVSLLNFPGVPGSSWPNTFFRNSPQWQVVLYFQKQKVVMAIGHLARIPTGSFLWQMIEDVTAKYNNGVPIDVDVPPTDCDAGTGLCKWRAEDFVALRQSFHDVWTAGKVPPDKTNSERFIGDAQESAAGPVVA